LEWDARAAAIFAATDGRTALDVWRERVHPEDHALVARLFDDARSAIGAECVYRIVLPDGEVRQVLTRGVAIELGPDGEPEVLTGVVLETETSLGPETLLADALESISLGFMILDEDMTVRYVNAQSERHLGVSREHLLGRHLHVALPATKGSYFDALHRDVVRRRGEATRRATSLYLPGKTIEVTASYVDGAVVVNFKDVTETVRTTGNLLAAYEEILVRSRLDHLTGVLNRAALFERVSRISDELGTRTTVLFIDVDNFKSINDGYGHVVGDLVLRTTAARLAEQCDADAVFGRIGGDEFVAAIFDDGSSESSAIADRLADRMRTATGNPIQVADYSVSLSVSIGIAHSLESDTLADLLTRADLALYRSKSRAKPEKLRRLPVRGPTEERK
jgi:diguanylate cyclase (GGDEF)-like protein/PAS domain S-box-containing protein